MDKKEQNNKFTDNMRFLIASLLQSIDKISVIDKKIVQIDKKESENEFIDNMRSITASLWHSKYQEINRAISQIELIKKFPNTYKFSNGDLNKFYLLLRKDIYLYECMDSWKRFNETELPDKESLYNKLNKEGKTDEDYAHAQKVWKEFNIKNLGKSPDLYVQSDTFLLADVFENFREKCLEIYELDPARFLSAPGLA